MSAKKDGELNPAEEDVTPEDEESDEYDEEYNDDEDQDEDGENSQDDEEEGEGGENLTALLIGSGAEKHDDERDKGWTPDGGPEPAEDSEGASDKEASAPISLKGKAPAAAKREREEAEEEEAEEGSTQSKRTKT